MDATSTSSGPRPAPRRGPELRDSRWLFDFGYGVVLAVVTVAPYTGSDDRLSVVAGLGLVSAVVFRRTLPTLAVVVAIGSALLFWYASARGGAVMVVVPIMVYSAARWMSPRLGHLSLVAALGGALIGPVRWLSVGRLLDVTTFAAYGAVVLACAGIVVGAYLIGRRRSDSVAVARQQEAAEAERLRLVQAEEEQRARSASVSERQRIARELHDIVAHSLSVIVVQAEGGKALTIKHPERAPEVLGTIADAGREALVEMRRMVGLLRENDDSGSRAPAPGLFDLTELVRRSGVRADLQVHGATPAVHPALGLTAYRIVQESLTNVLKHAGPAARTTVRVHFRAEAIAIEVADDGRGVAPGPGRGGGHGLTGMAERVAIHGGTLTAGPRPGPPGGFVVTAELPLHARRWAGGRRVGP